MKNGIIFGLLAFATSSCAPNYHFREPGCETQKQCQAAQDVQIGRMWTLAQQALGAEIDSTSQLSSPDTWTFERIEEPTLACGTQQGWGCINVLTRRIQWVRGRPLVLAHECMHAILFDLQRTDWVTYVHLEEDERLGASR